MKFTRDKTAGYPRWVSACGNYVVWRNAQVREAGGIDSEWGAQHMEFLPYLIEAAGSRGDAIEICREHARKALARGGNG